MVAIAASLLVAFLMHRSDPNAAVERDLQLAQDSHNTGTTHRAGTTDSAGDSNRAGTSPAELLATNNTVKNTPEKVGVGALADDSSLQTDDHAGPNGGDSDGRGVPMVVTTDKPPRADDDALIGVDALGNDALANDALGNDTLGNRAHSRARTNGSAANPNVASLSVAPIESVAKELQTKWQQYWKAIGVTPSAEATAETVAARVSQQLGVSLAADTFGDAQTLRTSLVQDAVSRSIAVRWLASVTGVDERKLTSRRFESLVGDAASAFRAEVPLDENWVRWMQNGDEPSSEFYDAFSAGGHDAMVRRLASVTMDVDLRCTRCHDALIEGNGRQESYWSFASFLKKGLKRSRNGQWSIVRREQFSSKPSFYELPDGRQRFVQPKIDPNWINKKPADDVAQWAANLKGSAELARGMVNSIWRLVHGRSLRGHVIETSVAPHHQLLDDVQRQLADDLVASNFDVSRTLALVLTSPPSRREVPKVLLPKNQLMASADQIRQSMHTVDAFAAAQPNGSGLPLSRRLSIAMKSVGGSLKDLDGSDQLLANIRSGLPPNTSAAADDFDHRIFDGVDFPTRADALPVQWLASIESYENRVQHLGYLANHANLPAALIQAAQALRSSNDHDGGNDDDLALNRVWWLIRP